MNSRAETTRIAASTVGVIVLAVAVWFGYFTLLGGGPVAAFGAIGLTWLTSLIVLIPVTVRRYRRDQEQDPPLEDEAAYDRALLSQIVPSDVDHERWRRHTMAALERYRKVDLQTPVILRTAAATSAAIVVVVGMVMDAPFFYFVAVCLGIGMVIPTFIRRDSTRTDREPYERLLATLERLLGEAAD